MNPLHLLTHGSILIVGAKASNFSDEIKNNPRVAMWDSESKNPGERDLPVNTRAIFFTRWCGHSNFASVMKEARKRRITVFTPQGTGVIAKQVKELLGMNGTEVTKVEAPHLTVEYPETLVEAKTKMPYKNKLKPLIQFLDVNKTDAQNGAVLLAKAQELGIQTTIKSLTVFSSREKRKIRGIVGPVYKRTPITRTPKTLPKYERVDVTIEIFDGIIKEMTDMREFLVKTVEENATLKARIAKFKQFMDGSWD